MTYPPCISGGPYRNANGCAPGACCFDKTEWPELVGKSGVEAKNTIERENPEVTAVIVHPPWIVIQDYCYNRAWVKVSDDGLVVAPGPKVG
ncbi:hypothetical protein RND81_01G001800 [Saponaria officinalis]|uniref:Uncharacterized protein n=1 Tax=Saponaria officinalis TaxID=3572 RepID=A0AAW1NEY6_SAPOF